MQSENKDKEKNMSNEPEIRNYADYVPNYAPEPNPYDYRIGFFRRLGAYIIDNIIIMLLVIIAMFATGIMSDLLDSVKQGGYSLDFGNMEEVSKRIIPIYGVIVLLYFSSELFFGASLGKMMLAIRIGADDRTIATFPKLLVRFVIKNISVIFSLIAYLLSLIFIDLIGDILQFIIYFGFFFTFSFRRQAFHDMLSATAVYFNYEIIENNNQ